MAMLSASVGVFAGSRWLLISLVLALPMGWLPGTVAERQWDDEPWPEDHAASLQDGRRKSSAVQLAGKLATDLWEGPAPPGYMSSVEGEPLADAEGFMPHDGFAEADEPSGIIRAPVTKASLYKVAKAMKDASGKSTYADDLAAFWKKALVVFVAIVSACAALVAYVLPSEIEPRGAEPVQDKGEAEPTDAAIEGEQAWFGGFKQKSLEKRWLNASYRGSISTGSRLLACAAVGYFVYRTIRLAKRSDPGSCLPVNWVLAVVEMGCLALALASSIFCFQYPGRLYWVVLAFFFFYTLASTLPPFAFSCTELVEQCADSTDPYIMEASRHADCTLEGYTAQQTIMTWILVLPWAVPRRSLMLLAWVWLFLIYGGWTLIYRYSLPTAQRTFELSAIIFHLALLSLTLVIATTEKSALEDMQRMMFIADLRMKEASQRLFKILKYMVPVHVVVPMIKRPGKVIAEHVDRVTILFILIEGFDEIAEKLSPEKVLEFLNEYFTKFDDICEANKVTKIETVGEEYVCCVGVMPEDVAEGAREGHSKILHRLLLAADQILRLQTETVRFKMGMHSGPIVAGVIGQRLPRYRLFGDTINTAARLMQKGHVGQLQFGEETHRDLPQGIPAQLRGEIELKGKGQFKAYLCEKIDDGATQLPCTIRPKRTSIFTPLFGKDQQGSDVGATYTYTPPLASNQSAQTSSSQGCDEHGQDGLAHLPDVDPEFERVLAATNTEESKDSELEGQALEDWKRWHHINKVCTKITRRLDVQLLVLTLLTAIEATYMNYFHETERSNRGIPAHMRFPLFVGCRVTVLVIILAWRIAAANNSEWFQENAATVLVGRLLSWCAIGIILFISYDDLTPDERAVVEQGHALVEIAPFSQNFSLVFVLVYTLVTRVQGMLFYPSLVFIPVAIALMVNAEVEENENIVASIPAKVFFVVNAIMSSAICHTDEQTSLSQYKAKVAVESTTSRVQGILSTLMPPLVLEELRKLPPGSHPTHTYKLATICQSDLCGFTQLSATRKPHEVVGFMGELFGRFDELTHKYGVYKVETVGDAYIAGTAEEPLTPTNLPVNVVLFGLAMVEAVQEWSRNMGESVNCRVGVHHGECIGGVVGTGMQRYHLFGKLLCGMEILESTAPEGHVQVSIACKAEVEKHKEAELLEFNQREEPHLKTSKGFIHEYESVGGRTFVVALKGGGSLL